jgi:hypothetical protein
MVDFKKKIEQQKLEDKKRAGKKRKSVTGDRPVKVKTPTQPKATGKNPVAAAFQAVGNIFKKDDDYLDLYANSIPTAKDFATNWGGSGFEVGGGHYKKGGRIKKTKVKKRAALRGQRSELRGS